MSTNRLESTGNNGLDKKGMRTSSAHDLTELGDEELKGVAGGMYNYYQALQQFHPTWTSLQITQFIHSKQKAGILGPWAAANVIITPPG